MSWFSKIAHRLLLGLRAVAFAVILTMAASTAAQASLTPTPQPPDQPVVIGTPNFVDITELSDIDLHVSMSFLGYDFTGDLVPAFPGAQWGIGPHFQAFIGANTLDNVTGISRIYWLQPGSSMADLADARLSGFDIGSCFCGNGAANLQFVSNLQYDDLLNSDPSNFWRLYACRNDNKFDNCPILTDGASQIVPIAGELPSGYFSAPAATITFHDARFDTGVPEPSTWAMMILGFAVVGAARRSRRRMTIPAVASISAWRSCRQVGKSPAPIVPATFWTLIAGYAPVHGKRDRFNRLHGCIE